MSREGRGPEDGGEPHEPDAAPEPEDRLGDLGPRRARSAGEPELDLGLEGRSPSDRLAELDELEQPPPPEPARPGSRYSWVVGVAALILIAVVLLNGISAEGPGSRGLEAGDDVPVFAAPLATGTLDGDANLCKRAPCPDGAGRVPACEVRGPSIFNVCELRRKPLVIGYFFLRQADCLPHLNLLQRVSADFPGVQFAAVVGGEKRERVERVVRERKVTFPVATDRDLQVSNALGIAGCPTTTFAYAGGRVRETRLGNIGEPELRAAVRDLLRGLAPGSTGAPGA